MLNQHPDWPALSVLDNARTDLIVGIKSQVYFQRVCSDIFTNHIKLTAKESSLIEHELLPAAKQMADKES